MSVFERYQLFNTAEQHLFDPACPVFVHRTQLTQDLQSGAVLLQVRMVNMGDRALRGVYLRVTCLDEKDQVLTVMHFVPLTELDVPKGGVFGDDRVVTLRERETRGVRVYVQRAVYDDGAVWNEAERPDYIRLPAPVAVLPTDKDYGYLSQMSQSGGVKNDTRYQTLSCGWYCTCGLPNSSWRKRCGYCGADREWLFTHMKAPAEPLAEPEPPKEEKPAPAVPAILPDLEPAPVFFTPVLRDPEPDPEPAYGPPEEEFPVIAPTQPPEKKSRVGLIVAIVLLALGVLAALGYCAWRFALPLYRYNQGETLLAAGQYAEARQVYTGLGDFRDSPERVKETWYLEAKEMMQAGNYAEAYQVFQKLPGYENVDDLAAGCLCSQGILAFNAGDYTDAWGYVEQLRELYPDYTEGETLATQTAYQLGCQAMDNEEYETAKEWLAKTGGYSDSQERMVRCDYEEALLLVSEGSYPEAIEALRALDGYENSDELILGCMFEYLTETGASEDPQLASEYMQFLLQADYPGARELYDWRVTLAVNESDTDAVGGVGVTSDLTKLRIHCGVTGGLTRDPLTVVLIYTLPDKRSGTVTVITAENGQTGTLSWSNLGLPSCNTSGTVILKFCDEAGNELRTFTLELRIPEPTEG